MKLKITFLFLGFAALTNAQILNIPDANFKAKLLQANATNDIARDSNGTSIKIDINNNNEIDQSEALHVYTLQVHALPNTPNTQKIADLTGINAFSNLKALTAFNNLISGTDLTALTHLEYVDFTSNGLSSINLNGLSNLKRIICANNNLTTLNISGMSNLEILNCGSNQITALDLSDKPKLQQLEARFNNISALDVSGLIMVTDLVVNDNPISVLDVSAISKIQTLQTMNTNLTVLDVSNQTNLTTLMIGGSLNLQKVFMKNGSIETGLNFINLPSLKYICVDEGQLSLMQAVANSTDAGTVNCSVNTYCSFTPGGNYFMLQGNSRYDFEGNGCDNTDPVYPNLKVNVTSPGGFLNGTFITGQSGAYSIPVQQGNYTFTPVLQNPAYYTVDPTSISATFSSISPQIQNFCVVPNGIHYDLEVTLIPVNNAVPGFDAVYKAVYKNKGNQIQSGSVQIQFNDAALDFISSVPNVSAQVNNLLSWNFSNLQPFESREIVFNMNLNTPTETPPLNSGDILHFNTAITDFNDEVSSDNVAVLHQAVVNSFDPNDKICLEGAAISPDSVGKYVHYMIRFENTGTANAQNIVVKDIIDTSKFDIASLLPVSGSHAFKTKIFNGNHVEFIFENINLPFADAYNDGYVVFKIKTKPTLALGNTFANLANIYFDYNLPIVTNNFVTTIQNTLDTSEAEVKKDLMIYPNPVQDILVCTSDEKIINAFIYDVAGRMIRTVSFNDNKTDIKDLQAGTYILKINMKSGSKTTKFIKN